MKRWEMSERWRI